MNRKVNFVVGPQGALEASKREDVCIVVDVLRASSSLIAAFMGNFLAIRLGDNRCYDIEPGVLAAGEWEGKKIDHFTYGNSPIALAQAAPDNAELMFFSTNGIPCIQACAEFKVPILIGAIINAQAVSRLAKEIASNKNKNISIVLAGFHGELEEDDLLAGSQIYRSGLQEYELISDYELLENKGDMGQKLLQSPAGRRLAKLNSTDDVLYCAQQDITTLVPVFCHKTQKIILNSGAY